MAAYQCLNCEEIARGDSDCCSDPDLFRINDMPGEILRLRALVSSGPTTTSLHRGFDMSYRDLKNAFSLLVPRVVGTVDGKKVIYWPSISAFLIALLANGRTVLMNRKPSVWAPNAPAGDPGPKGAVICFNEFEASASPEQQSLLVAAQSEISRLRAENAELSEKLDATSKLNAARDKLNRCLDTLDLAELAEKFDGQPSTLGTVVTPQATTVWMIERGPNQGEVLHLWWSETEPNQGITYHRGEWVNDANKATHYSTKDEAEKATKSFGIRHSSITSHQFLPPRPAVVPKQMRGPMTVEQRTRAWLTSPSGIVPWTAEAYMQGIADAEAYYGITGHQFLPPRPAVVPKQMRGPMTDECSRVLELVVRAAEDRASKDWQSMHMNISEAAEIARGITVQAAEEASR
jgi:hypothetical protein